MRSNNMTDKEFTKDISEKNSIANVIVQSYPLLNKNVTTKDQIVDILNAKVTELNYIGHGIAPKTWDKFINRIYTAKTFKSAMLTVGSYQLAGAGMKVI